MPPLRDINTNMPPKAKSYGKRGAAVVDLTEDEHSPANQARPLKRAAHNSTDASQTPRGSELYSSDSFDNPLNASVVHSEAERTEWLQDDTDINETVASSQDDAHGTGELQLYGVLSGKVVGVRFYRGVATPGERVLIRREPRNPYDKNAVRIDNIEMQQLGHLPRKVVEKLSKYIDNRWATVEGTLTGRIGDFDAPIDLSIYGPDPTSPEGQQLLTKLKADKLPWNVIKESMKAEKDAEKQRQQQEKARLAEARRAAAGAGRGQDIPDGETTYASQSQPGFGEAQMTDILENVERFDPRRVGETTESYGQNEDSLSKMPLADQPAAVKTQMLPYQLQALQWLLDQENPQLPVEGSKDTMQLWQRDVTNKKAFINIATNHATTEVPALACGGILADDMGLGKTLEMISLIVSDNAKHGKKTGTTLIVAPLSVMSNWTDQAAHHLHKKHALKCYIFHGKGAVPLRPHELSEYDVVITTYQTLASDHSPRGASASTTRKTGLYSMTWRRIILDEGHIIRNPSSKGAAAVMAVDAKMRWVLTGTPIVNTLKDLYCLLKFVGIKGGLQQLEIFNSVLVRPLNGGDQSAAFLLKAIMKSFALRRKKEMSFIDLKLPPLEEYLQRLDFTENERKRYAVLEDEAQGVMKAYMAKDHGQVSFQTLLEILLRMRQCCNHWQLCGERVTKLLEQLGTQQTVALTPENVKALQDVLQIRIESQEECAICLETLHNPVITPCGHPFGRECITKTIETQHKCPLCRADLQDETYLVEAANECGDAEKLDGMDASESSSKLEALLKILEATKNEGKGEKTIIFSQWTRFLDIVQAKITERGYKFTRLDGTMKAAERDGALAALEHDKDCSIMLASLGVCAVGLNLVAANNIILSDSWWAPAIEDQAVDRVHRLGQKRPTRVFRLVMDETIEDTVLDIQQKKRALMRLALSENKSKRDAVKQGRLADIQKLLGWKS